MNEIMAKGIKSYLVFTSFLYRIVMFLVVPLAMAGISLWAGTRGGMAGVLPAVLLFPLVETMSDCWLFGGIQTKDPARMDYLKASGRGMEIMRAALSVDLGRKLLSDAVALTAGFMGICLELKWTGGGTAEHRDVFLTILPGSGDLRRVWLLLFLIAMSWFFSVLGTFLSRYGSMMWINMGIGYFMALFEMPGLFLLMTEPEYVGIYFLVFAALGLAASVLTVRTGMKKIRMGYYD